MTDLRLIASTNGSPTSAAIFAPSISMVVSGTKAIGVFSNGLAWYLARSMAMSIDAEWVRREGLADYRAEEGGGCFCFSAKGTFHTSLGRKAQVYILEKRQGLKARSMAVTPSYAGPSALTLTVTIYLGLAAQAVI